MISELKLLGLALVLGAGISASPAFAQAEPEAVGPPAPKIVPKCRNMQTGEIVVCAQPRSPYRLPQATEGFDPEGDDESVSRERNSLLEEGDSGIGSCSNVGAGGGFGCNARRARAQNEQRGGKKKGIIARIGSRNEPEPVPGN